MSSAANDTATHMLVASQPMRSIVEDILHVTLAPAIVPLGVLIAPLARRYAGDFEEFLAKTSGCLVIERIGAVRTLPIADGDRLGIESYLKTGTTSGEAGLQLLSLTSEAFRCEIQQIELAPERLAPPRTPAQNTRNAKSVEISVAADQHLAYAQASGDFNPLHMDKGRCAELGLPERIVHGTLLATLAEAMVQPGETGTIAMRFASPCFVGELLSASISERPHGAMRVTIWGVDGRLVCAMDWRP